MAQLYANENFPLKVVYALRDLGHDILTSYDEGKANQAISDLDVLSFASENQRVLLTLNRRDFIKLHRLGHAHAGIVVCSQDRDVAAQAQRIHTALMSVDCYEGALIRVPLPPSS